MERPGRSHRYSSVEESQRLVYGDTTKAELDGAPGILQAIYR